MKILIMNGPNLNRLGQREPDSYGNTPMESCLQQLQASYPQMEMDYFQRNVEGFLIDRIQQAANDGTQGIVLNAGAYTHTSIALHDAMRSIPVPVVEVHLSNVHQREEFRHHSMISSACCGVICGFGTDVYRLGIEALQAIEKRHG